MREPPRPEHGMTLIEVLVAVVILGIAAIALLGGMTTTVASSSIGRQQADAESILTSVTEAVQDPTLYPFQDASLNCPPDYAIKPGTPTIPPGWQEPRITDIQYWDGSAFQGNCTASMQRLTITVTSPNGQVNWSRQVVKGAPA